MDGIKRSLASPVLPPGCPVFIAVFIPVPYP